MLALIMAIVVGLAVYMFAMSVRNDMQTVEALKKSVVVAVVEIPADTLISADMVVTVDLPEEAVHPQAIGNIADAIGKISQYPFVPQEQILSSRLKVRSETSNRLSYALDSGYRAITLSVDNVSGVSGHLTKGDHVDLIVTAEFDGAKASKYQLENLLILRLGMNSAAPTENAAYATVTLAATTEQILNIHYAMNNDRITLVLRPVADQDEANLPPYTEATPDTDMTSDTEIPSEPTVTTVSIIVQPTTQTESTTLDAPGATVQQTVGP